jgi:hypothetical protein
MHRNGTVRRSVSGTRRQLQPTLGHLKLKRRMDMNAFRGSMFGRGSMAAHILFVAMALLAGVSIPANAQTVAGTFTFTQDTRWGASILPAGKYTYSIEEYATTPVIIFHGEGKDAKSGFIFSANWSEADELRASKIELVSDHGEMTVHSFAVAALGKVFTYPVSVKMQHAAASKPPVQTAMSHSASSAGNR